MLKRANVVIGFVTLALFIVLALLLIGYIVSLTPR